MNAVKLTKWGNSLGLRLPQFLVKALDCHEGELFDLVLTQKQELLLRPRRVKHEGWKEAFDAEHEAGADVLLLGEHPTKFDEEEWTW